MLAGGNDTSRPRDVGVTKNAVIMSDALYATRDADTLRYGLSVQHMLPLRWRKQK